MATDLAEQSPWCRIYDLSHARNHVVPRQPAAHQSQALGKLDGWYSASETGDRGGILVLPTGGGKTFTAVYFLCSNPVSRGHKVLWLAHTHHLLEQAFAAFEPAVPIIQEPRQRLQVRVVSGAVGHFPIHTISSCDDVLICSLQAASRALQCEHPQLEAFLESAGDDLFVVFDEAHHSPAPSYRRLLAALRDKASRMCLLGLTATPVYHDERKSGWLTKLFPQRIVAQADPRSLMAAGILSRPEIEEVRTTFEPEFDERECRKWSTTYRDLPEDIIQHLAANRARNDYIVAQYLEHRERYGRTIIFADRWHQCDYLREALIKAGVRADVVYSHIDADPGNADARRRRTSDENAAVLRSFREGTLDVLLNVRMLTEGTDVPDVQTVFLTRQTTSQVLLTQMVGRALRGPAFGGTEKAYIVSFIDNWKHCIKWASYDQLKPGGTEVEEPCSRSRTPLQLISIELIRRLSREMHHGVPVSVEPFLRMLPIGWYQVEFEAAVAGSDDREIVQELVLVFEGQDSRYQRLIDSLATIDLACFINPEVALDDVLDAVCRWKDEFFAGATQVGDGLTADLFAVARHIAQNEGEPPRFFTFEARADHNLDQIAARFIDRDLGPRATDEEMRREFSRLDRFWKTLYYNYPQFKSHFDACVQRALDARRHGADPDLHKPVITTPETLPDQQADDDARAETFDRDGNRCVCCHSTRQLQLDHISSRYFGPIHDPDNLQTLCSTCNGLKQTDTIDFRKTRTDLSQPPANSTRPRMPTEEDAGDPVKWERYLRRYVNFFYRCAAVRSLEVGARGGRLRVWRVALYSGNDPRWLEPHLPVLAAEIQHAKELTGFRPGPDLIELMPRVEEPSGEQPPGGTENGGEPEPDGPSRPIDQIDRNEVLATIRAVFSAGGKFDREQAIHEVASALSIRRVGSRVRDQLSKDLFTAVLRGILQNDNGEYSLFCRSVEQYTREHLVKILLAAIGPTWLTRDEAIVAAARQLGYRRTGKDIQAAFKSAMNSAIRSGSIERDGPENIRKAR